MEVQEGNVAQDPLAAEFVRRGMQTFDDLNRSLDRMQQEIALLAGRAPATGLPAPGHAAYASMIGTPGVPSLGPYGGWTAGVAPTGIPYGAPLETVIPGFAQAPYVQGALPIGAAYPSPWADVYGSVQPAIAAAQYAPHATPVQPAVNPYGLVPQAAGPYRIAGSAFPNQPLAGNPFQAIGGASWTQASSPPSDVAFARGVPSWQGIVPPTGAFPPPTAAWQGFTDAGGPGVDPLGARPAQTLATHGGYVTNTPYTATSAAWAGAPTQRFRDVGELRNAAPQVRMPHCDLVDEGSAFEVRMELPGVAKEDLDITCYPDCVVVNARHALDIQEGSLLLGESGNVVYRRTIELPAQIKTSECEAKLQDGMLTLTLQKQVPTEGPRHLDVAFR